MLEPKEWFSFEGKKSTDLGVVLLEYLCPPGPSCRFRSVIVPGRDGSLLAPMDGLADVDVTLRCAVLGEGRAAIWDKLRVAVAWLQGDGKLMLWDQPGLSRKVRVEKLSQENFNDAWAEFLVSLKGEPFLLGGEKEAACNQPWTVEGTAPCFGKVSLTLPAKADRVDMAGQGGRLSFVCAMEAQGVVEADMEKGEITLNGIRRNECLTMDSRFFPLLNGEEQVTVQRWKDGQSASVSGTVIYHPSWL